MSELRITKRFKRFLNNLLEIYALLAVILLAIAVLILPPALASIYLLGPAAADESVELTIVLTFSWWVLVVFPVGWALVMSHGGDRQ